MSRVPQVAFVDDDDAVREALDGMLSAFGYDGIGFASAEDFLACEDLTDFKCLIVDIALGGMTGLQLISLLKELGYAIPVVVITASCEVGLRERCLAAGALVVFAKPICVEDLRIVLDRILGGEP